FPRTGMGERLLQEGGVAERDARPLADRLRKTHIGLLVLRHAALVYPGEDARETHFGRPSPYFQRAGATGDGEEDDIGASDEVFLRHEADGEAAGGGILPIVG